MESIKSLDRRQTLLIVTIAFCAAFVGWIYGPWFGPPQIGYDEEVYKTVDALFTAINSRNQKQLDECARRLSTYGEAGRLSKKPAKFLESVIAEANAGEWKPAAKRLYGFIYGQQRK